MLTVLESLPRRALPIRGPIARYLRLPVLWPRSRLLLNLREPNRTPERKVEIPHHVLRVGRVRNHLHLLPVA